MHKACLKYSKWKSAQKNPDYRPWANPECLKVPRIDWNDIKTLDSTNLNNNLEDESQISEKDVANDENDD